MSVVMPFAHSRQAATHKDNAVWCIALFRDDWFVFQVVGTAGSNEVFERLRRVIVPVRREFGTGG